MNDCSAAATTTTSKLVTITTFIIKCLFSNNDTFRFFRRLPKAELLKSKQEPERNKIL